MSPALKAWNRVKPYAIGRWLFTRVVCFRAPYFSSIRPRFVQLGEGRAEVSMRKRRSVTNHIGTVHAIAMANLCEIAAGTMIEALLDPSMRWIPKGMNIRYLAKASTDVRALATMPPIQPGEAQDAVIPVIVLDQGGTEIVAADITMYVTPRPARS